MKNRKISVIKFISIIILTVFLIYFTINCKYLLKLPTDTFIVEDGTLSYEESATGYILRDEYVLRGEEYKNGMVQIKSEGERAAKGETVFRYYSNGEEELTQRINTLDKQINEAMANNDATILTKSDISNLDKQIEKNINELYRQNEVEKIIEYKKQIENYMTKKSQIAGEQSTAGSYIKQLIDERNSLKDKLNQNAINIEAKEAGIVSYRVDGLENILTVNDLSYLNSELLNSFDINVGAIIPQSNEEGKIINNFYCYIACSINTENAMEAKEGDSVKIRFSNSNEVNAQIIKIIEEENNRILVLKIKDGVENLIEYRKLSFDIIWWQFSGWKVSNNALIEKDDLSYVERKKANYTEEILVKVLRQNDIYSIVTNYDNEELKNLGYSAEEIKNMKKIKLYDEILLH
ncbi:MAG: HlyD family efflux transporter periplasmic adaptor subunit [Candidatus Scatovivens sp.]